MSDIRLNKHEIKAYTKGAGSKIRIRWQERIRMLDLDYYILLTRWPWNLPAFNSRSPNQEDGDR